MKAYGSIFAAALLAVCHPVFAQFDPAKVAAEPDFISRQFTTTSNFSTPAFAAGRENFTSYAEAANFIDFFAHTLTYSMIAGFCKVPQSSPTSLCGFTNRTGFQCTFPICSFIGPPLCHDTRSRGALFFFFPRCWQYWFLISLRLNPTLFGGSSRQLKISRPLHLGRVEKS